MMMMMIIIIIDMNFFPFLFLLKLTTKVLHLVSLRKREFFLTRKRPIRIKGVPEKSIRRLRLKFPLTVCS